MLGGEGGGGAKSYEGEKAWSSINPPLSHPAAYKKTEKERQFAVVREGNGEGGGANSYESEKA